MSSTPGDRPVATRTSSVSGTALRSAPTTSGRSVVGFAAPPTPEFHEVAHLGVPVSGAIEPMVEVGRGERPRPER